MHSQADRRHAVLEPPMHTGLYNRQGASCAQHTNVRYTELTPQNKRHGSQDQRCGMLTPPNPPPGACLGIPPSLNDLNTHKSPSPSMQTWLSPSESEPFLLQSSQPSHLEGPHESTHSNPSKAVGQVRAHTLGRQAGELKHSRCSTDL